VVPKECQAIIDVIKLRQLYESRIGSREQPNPRGRTSFVNTFRHWLGLCDEQGRNYRDRNGRRALRESHCRPEEFSLQELAEACCGPVWRRFFNPELKQGHAALVRHNALLESQYPGDARALLEAAGVGVDVSAFADINAWTGVTGGLIERKILEAFENPSYIGDELMPPEPTKVAEGQKVIGVSRLGDQATERQPGEAHHRAQLLERWVTLGKTRENALAVDVTKEAGFFDLTGQVLEHASQHGDWIAYRQEMDRIDAFIGVTTQSGGKYQFSYKGTGTNTYQSSNANALGYVNELAANELIDWKSVEAAWKLANRQLDPETNTRVLVNFDRVVVNPARLATADLIFGARESSRRTAAGGLTMSTATDLHVLVADGNVVKRFGDFKIIWSPLLEQRCTDASGLNLSQANADQYWWLYQRNRFMRWMLNWPLTIVQAPANNYEMVDRGLVFSTFANERGMPSVWSPWHVMLSTN
jgi:hypothetical protein